jgi:biopolymer transport protein ExbD
MSMEMSRRAKRMEKHHKRRKGTATLNMVSLMDIFTILVFFLLVNQQGLQAQGGGKIVLPKSTAEKFPKDTLVVSVSAQDVFVQGRKVADVAQVMASKDILIPGLQQELKYQSGKQSVLGETKKQEKPVTIMGDQEIPYALLKKIMLTCSQSGYSEVSLAVTRSKGAGS